MRSFERRSFGGALKLLIEENEFKDWVGDAKRNPSPVPVLSLPDTPVANFEIRLVEPTPVPSRSGSLGASLATGGLMVSAAIPPRLNEEEEQNERAEDAQAEASSSRHAAKVKPRSSRKKGKFFLHSSPSKASGSESPHASHIPQIEVHTGHSPPRPSRHDSGSSSGGVMMKVKKDRDKRHVSLSTMKGKFAAEKRKAADAIAQAKEDEEGSGWEDEDAEAEEGEEEMGEGEEEMEEEGWSDESASPVVETQKMRRSSSRSRSGHSSSNLDLTQLVMKKTSRRRKPPEGVPPPPAPTPLRKMSKKERQQAAAERTMIEAELDAQRKREMFAKKQIFGDRPAGEGLLSQVLRTGGSMVDLVSLV